MEIRRATEDDLREIGILWLDMMRCHERLDERLAVAAEPEALFETYLLRVMVEGDHLVLVATEDDKVVGYLNARVKERPPIFRETRHGEIIELTVDPRYRRLGIGGALVDRARDWFVQRRVSRMEVTAAEHNEVGVSFWRRQGFEGYFLTMIADIIRARDQGEEQD